MTNIFHEKYNEGYDDGFEDGVRAALAEIQSVVEIPKDHLKAILNNLKDLNDNV